MSGVGPVLTCYLLLPVPACYCLQVFLWDVGSGNFIRKFRGHEGTVNTVRGLGFWGHE